MLVHAPIARNGVTCKEPEGLLYWCIEGEPASPRMSHYLYMTTL